MVVLYSGIVLGVYIKEFGHIDIFRVIYQYAQKQKLLYVSLFHKY